MTAFEAEVLRLFGLGMDTVAIASHLDGAGFVSSEAKVANALARAREVKRAHFEGLHRNNSAHMIRNRLARKEIEASATEPVSRPARVGKLKPRIRLIREVYRRMLAEGRLHDPAAEIMHDL